MEPARRKNRYRRMKRLSDFADAHLRIFDRPDAPAPDEIASVHLIGICGTGMGSLAGLLKDAGYAVQGSDEHYYPPMSTRIAEAGITMLEGYDAQHLDPPPDLVIVGNACTPTHPEASYAREQGLTQLSLPEAIAHFFLYDRKPLVIAGTHGKTTTTGMLVHILRSAGMDPGFLVGGLPANGGASYGVGAGPHFVVEGDEYDSAYFDKRPKMMHYRPASAVITSLEFDHADIYDTWEDYREAFREFAGLVDPDGLLVLNGNDPEVRALANYTRARVAYIGFVNEKITVRNVRPAPGGQRFTLLAYGQEQTEVFLPMSGRHNLLNALGVCAIALDEGITPAQIADGFASFSGMKRRQEVLGEADGVLVVDDFAHHPTAVSETVRAIAERWPDRRIVAVFEPRSNSSRRKVFEEPYGHAFDRADAVFISAPPVRHNDRAGDLLDAERVGDMLKARGIPATIQPNTEGLLPPLLDTLRSGDVALIMSNGSFDGLHTRLIAALSKRESVAAKPA